eukprot:4115966-Pyramimonas_sp.AAC.1
MRNMGPTGQEGGTPAEIVAQPVEEQATACKIGGPRVRLGSEPRCPRRGTGVRLLSAWQPYDA